MNEASRSFGYAMSSNVENDLTQVVDGDAPERRPWQFSLRSLMSVMTVCAVGAWLIARLGGFALPLGILSIIVPGGLFTVGLSCVRIGELRPAALAPFTIVGPFLIATGLVCLYISLLATIFVAVVWIMAVIASF